eukprot:scaffold104174_cov39-Attheya_sp.AAC.1
MILPEDVYEMQKNYTETVKKPFSMSVRDFVKRIRQLASFLPEFPKPVAASGLSQTDQKNIIFRGMPSAWQENFVHANMRIADVTLAQMTDYLVSEQIIADTKRDRANGGRGRGGRSTSIGCTDRVDRAISVPTLPDKAEERCSSPDAQKTFSSEAALSLDNASHYPCDGPH